MKTQTKYIFMEEGKHLKVIFGDFSISVVKSESWHGISYKKYKKHRQGTIFSDPVTKKAKILEPDDPEWRTSD